MKSNVKLSVCMIILFGLLASCGGSGGAHKVSSENVQTIELYLPSKIEYATIDTPTSHEKPLESVTVDAAFNDQDVHISTVMYDIDPNNSASATPIIKRDIIINYKGNVTSDRFDHVPFDINPEIKQYTYETDTLGNMIIRTFINDSASKTPDGTEKDEYTATGLIAQRFYYAKDISDSPLSIVAYEYDSNNHNTKEIHYDSGDMTKPAQTITFEYDDKGKIKSEITDTESDGTPDTRYVYTYDAQGYIILKSYYAYDNTQGQWIEDPSLTNAWYNHYDSEGKPIRIDFNKGNSTTIENYTYITWKKYTAPAQASVLKDMDYEELKNIVHISGN
jgi:hypothetical protein